MANKRVSRRKYAEALRVLKQAIANPNLSWNQRIRCVELLLCIYQVPIPETGRRERKAVKLLVEERSTERTVTEQVRAAVEEKAVEEAAIRKDQQIARALSMLRGERDGSNEQRP
jgi:uncharacterized protein (DUF1684 family)